MGFLSWYFDGFSLAVCRIFVGKFYFLYIWSIDNTRAKREIKLAEPLFCFGQTTSSPFITFVLAFRVDSLLLYLSPDARVHHHVMFMYRRGVYPLLSRAACLVNRTTMDSGETS